MVWAPYADRVDVQLVSPEDREVSMERGANGYFVATVAGIGHGARYYYRLNGEQEFPDPVSRYQPEGVHGPSEVVDPAAYDWNDAAWSGMAQRRLVFYELHVGTFTEEGTFDAVIPHLDRLRDLGITALEIMPVNQCPGTRNWGYDGVQLFAVQNSYGGPQGFRRLVDACHARGLAVFLDVVYNHLGPEGNYLGQYGPYFTEKYLTPWGPALNFDDQDSDDVRRFFIENALHWVSDYHIDGFRLDAIHAIKDDTPRPFLQEFTTAVHEHAADLGRTVHVIAESIRNNPTVCNPPELGGYGMDAEWTDDFHHALHSFITGETGGYYADFGRFTEISQVLQRGFLYVGQYSQFRGRRHGELPRLYNGEKFVVFAQNHDQTGNRAQGDRLTTMVGYETLKAIAGLVALSPYLPLFFMGEEYGETAPFQYFVDHSDPDLIEAVRKGRREEFASFGWQGDVPDPQDVATFERSRLNRELLDEPAHATLWRYHQQLLRLRREIPALADLEQGQMEVIPYVGERILFVRRWSGSDEVITIISFSNDCAVITAPVSEGTWRCLLNSADGEWYGPGAEASAEIQSPGELPITVPAMSCLVYHRVSEVL